jgi:hypothetical protein
MKRRPGQKEIKPTMAENLRVRAFAKHGTGALPVTSPSRIFKGEFHLARFQFSLLDLALAGAGLHGKLP